MRRSWLWAALLAGGILTAVADPLARRHSFRPVQESGVVIVPEGHLRRWDPVTIFFPQPTSPTTGPEDRPERYLDVFPDHPGAFTWLDPRTLQFQPAEPWPPLERIRWRARGEEVRLNTLMAPPLSSVPTDGADGLDPVEEITLSFRDALDTALLADMIEIDLQPTPGSEAGPLRTLGRDAFSVKALPRAETDALSRYAILLNEPIPLGTRAQVRFRLSVDSDGADGLTAATLRFSTAEPFRVTAMGCPSQRLPLSLGGVHYGPEQALDCGQDPARIVVEFSAPPAQLGTAEARSLVRFEPAVEGLTAVLSGRRLELRGDFEREQSYQVRLTPLPGLDDVHGRTLRNTGEASLFLLFPAAPSMVTPVSGDGIVERYGPQRIPLRGQGAEAVDVRIHRIDPTDLRLWPFSVDRPLRVDESARPPGPGEEPDGALEDGRTHSAEDIQSVIPMLGSPLVSEVLPLPLRADGASATFGLDLAPFFAEISGEQQPGTYLVGVRDLGSGSERAWTRVQVTDLSLTTIELEDAARLVVTSLATGMPVSGAQVRVEGIRRDSEGEHWEAFARGVTDRTGAFGWDAPGSDPNSPRSVYRIRVEKGDDRLIVDPRQPPQRYTAAGWQDSGRTWLQWAVEDLSPRTEPPLTLCHIFPERPVIRPEQPVHLKGYARQEGAGRLSVVRGEAWLTIRGPERVEEIPLSLSETGSLYHRFEDADGLRSGLYTVEMAIDGTVCGETDFTIDAYTIPRFEVLLSGAGQVALDTAFTVDLGARYYAGGRLAGRPVRWRVSQHPYAWTPKTGGFAGFLFSSDGRFSRTEGFVSAPRLETVTETDEQGQTRLLLDPTAEISAQPRTYAIEATVTGDDEQTVTATRRVVALPPFVIGLKVPRFLPSARRIAPEIVVLDADGVPLAGEPLQVRLLQRQWHGHLQAGDFTDGEARYVTETVDVLMAQQELVSGERPKTVSFDVPEAGVYLVEVSGADRMGRAVRVQADLFASGNEPVSWGPPEAGVFTITTDRDRYDPGQVASLVIESPFQSAEALVVVEAPDGPEFRWVSVRGGQGIARLVVGERWVPQVPVHVILMRGRLAEAGVVAGEDLGRPTTLAASSMISVSARRRRLQVALEHPEQARPGARVPLTVRLADHRGLPTAGEVTLWLVDAAVLALGREKPLDPVPSFLRFRNPRAIIRDTRNLAAGLLPYRENPGGDGDTENEDGGDPFVRATVRRNFSPVPYYNPAIRVPATGRVTVPVDLADSLTTFRVRAKAAAGDERFGYATSQIDVRLPVVVQPDLPRFLRPGDQFEAAAIGRLVEGEDGDVSVAIQAPGLQLEGPTQQSARLGAGAGTRVAFPARVPEDLRQEAVSVAVAVERRRDQVGDAFEVQIPVRPDRETARLHARLQLEPGQDRGLPNAPANAQDVRRTVLVTRRPELLAAAQATAALQQPGGGTVQRLSAARAWIGMGRLRERLGMPLPGADEAAQDALLWMRRTIGDDGLIAWWPGAPGSVSLTAWALALDAEMREAGHRTDPDLTARMVAALQQSVRSDDPRLVEGAAWLERTRALCALSAAGYPDEGYIAEAARAAPQLGPEAIAQVLLAAARAGQTNTPTTRLLVEQLVERARFALRGGEEVFEGIDLRVTARPSRILASEARSLAEMVRALVRQQPDHPRLPDLLDALVGQASPDGWGDPSADAAALLAIHDAATVSVTDPATITLTSGSQRLTLPLRSFAVHAAVEGPENTRVSLPDGAQAVTVDTMLSYTPGTPGAEEDPVAEGFVVRREASIRDANGTEQARSSAREGGGEMQLALGGIVEEHIQVVSPADRDHVTVIVPLAAGLELLNPRLATAPPEARTEGQDTIWPDAVDWQDDRVAFYFVTLPKGTWDLYFRARASTPGRFSQPPAKAMNTFSASVYGQSAGMYVTVE